ncbi:hypothetical protein [Aliarcobacter skirrowii]|uniref:hypothetical protein n=1 Tax=Aliarcobacter skirrowii TaxID=28200 RepID=UPI0029B63E52|nr:hypothetical protein [Aliarcobacter skirrowii]MDX4038446.1 hypothetical protein [Aliarcobacter skirrowii]
MEFILILSILFIIQFTLFRFMPIYRLNLKSQLYDYAKWVKKNPKVLVMGSSHARSQIIPEIIAKSSSKYTYEEIFNIGADAASPFSMYITYIKNYEKFKNVEIVYYTLDPHMLGEKYYLYTKFEKVFLSFKQWKYFTKYHKNYLKKHHQETNKYFFPSIIFFKSLEFNRPIFSGRNNGYAPQHHQPFKKIKPNLIAKYIYEPLTIFPVSKFEIQYLAKLKNLLLKDNKKLVFVLTPSYSWSKFYKKEAIEYDSQLINLLNKEVGESVIIGSLFGADFNLDFKDYKDDTHLAHSGAIKYTQQLFKNIDHHYLLTPKKFKSLFMYRFKDL